jgi:Leucine Rich repeat
MFQRRRAKKGAPEPQRQSDPSSVSSRSVRRRYIRNEQALDLVSKNICAEQAKDIAEELAANTTLKCLYVEKNYHGIGDAGMEALGQSLMQNDSLAELGLRSNKFGIVGLTSFADSLKINKGLKSLFLSNNSIDNEGAMALDR